MNLKGLNKKARNLLGLIQCIILSVVFSCNIPHAKYSSQVKTANKLLEYFENDDSSGVKSLIGIKSRYLSEDMHGLQFKIHKASVLLRRFGVPNSSKFVFKEYEGDYRDLEIIIPIINEQHSTSMDNYISISFSNYLPAEKIASFEVHSDSHPGLLIAPDTLKR